MAISFFPLEEVARDREGGAALRLLIAFPEEDDGVGNGLGVKSNRPLFEIAGAVTLPERGPLTTQGDHVVEVGGGGERSTRFAVTAGRKRAISCLNIGDLHPGLVFKVREIVIMERPGSTCGIMDDDELIMGEMFERPKPHRCGVPATRDGNEVSVKIL